MEGYKKKIAYKFNKASKNYDQYSKFQRECGNNLCKLTGCIIQSKLLDAGCGTGLFSRYWKSFNNQVIALDISYGMLEQAKRRNSANIYILGDIENSPLIDKTVDIIFSNLAIQWCNDFSRALSELYRILRPGGFLVLSTLIKGSLIELKQSSKNIDNCSNVNCFLPISSIYNALSPYRYKLINKIKSFYYSSVLDLLKDIKGVGSSYLYDRNNLGLRSKKYLNDLEKFWPYHNKKGFKLSYNVVYGIIYRD